MDEISHEQRQRALEYQLSPAGAASFSSLESSLPPLDDEFILVPDVPPPDQGINPATATIKRENFPPSTVRPNFGADRNGSSPYSAHSDPLNGSRRFDGHYIGPSGLNSLITFSTVMGDVYQGPRIPGHLDDEVFSQRGRGQEMIQNESAARR
ncbi:hypothetical protein H4Q26_013471 [Puccinia striiformis f. sp. tritici PST-130]|nr:hypothetical protein H4Q26_013471 [Puccinia striiformis f. sp. tritici PST-130]